MSRLNYIDTLGTEKFKNPNENNFQLNLHSPEEQLFYNPLSSIDKIKVQSLSETNLLQVYKKKTDLLIGYLNLARSLDISKARKKT